MAIFIPREGSWHEPKGIGILGGLMVFDLLQQRLRRTTGESGEIFGVRSPLRACPLGAHVDHQGGEVTGLALDRSVVMVAHSLDQPVVRMESLNFPGPIEVGLRGQPEKHGDWGDYLRAAVSVLQMDYRLDRGLSGVIRGDLPGMGLSSSAAVLVSFFLALAETNQLNLDRAKIAGMVQRAENEFIGLASGLLDQSVILFAEAGSLTHIDCSDFSVTQAPLPEGAPDPRVLVFFSGVSRHLVGTDYNSRVDQCRQAAAWLQEAAGLPVAAECRLGDVAPGIFESFGKNLPQPLNLRAAHYFGEIARVREGVDLWRHGNLGAFGALMSASGESSIVNYQCGTPPLVALYEELRKTPGVFGTRFSGAGFGGSCLALVEAEAADDVVERVTRDYAAAFPDLAKEALSAICRPAGPAAVVHAEDFSCRR
jgi:galactokinase